ncbi:MAG: hypothetical protein WC227_00520 [Patescibacteria group bacterium]
MKKFLQKFVFTLVALILVLNPYIELIPTDYFSSKAKAAINDIPDPEIASTDESDHDYEEEVDSDYTPEYSPNFIPDPVKDAFSLVVTDTTETFTDLTSTSSLLEDIGDAKIILTQSDFDAIKALRCMKNLLPPFAENMSKLYEFTIPEGIINSNEQYKNFPAKEEIDDAVSSEGSQATPRFGTPEEYLSYLKYGDSGDPLLTTNQNKEKFVNYVDSAKAYYGDDRLRADWLAQIDNLAENKTLDTDINTLACVTRITDAEQLMALIRESKTDETKRQYLLDRINESLDGLKIDIRAVKALIYLVTPKNKGGAGHWRIRVKKFLQTGRKSGESDALLTGAAKTVNCDPAKSAAECGMAQYQPGEATIEEKDGSAYTAYLESMNDGEQNDSMHQQGQAIDISEIDDIRCTIRKEVKQWGNVKGQNTPQPTRPIKLAWQTTEGFNKSEGANDFDMMSLIKSMATSEVVDFLGSINETDMSDYEGDLTRASFGDLVNVVGKSLMTEILASPDHNLKGYSTDSTLRNLGGIYIADYLGINRKLFTDKHINTPGDLFYEIGRGAIETRMKLPLNSLDTTNPAVPLFSTLAQTGTRKLEYELGLANGDLARLDPNSVASIYIGARVIEGTLNFKKFVWPSQDKPFAEFASTAEGLNWFDLLRLSPDTIDMMLHLKSGVTEALVKGKTLTPAQYDKMMKLPEGTTTESVKMNSDRYASIVGQVRLDETTFGFQYFAANDAAFSLPTGLWAEVIKFSPDTLQQSLAEVGIYTLSRLFGEDDASPLPKLEVGEQVVSIQTHEYGKDVTFQANDGNFGRWVFRSWLRDNLTKSTEEACQAPARPIEVDVSFDQAGAQQPNPNSLLDVQATFGTNVFKPVSLALDYQVTYNPAANGIPQPSKTLTKDVSEIRPISEEKATKYGFVNRDLQRIFGCASANGRDVYQRIGSELLYTALINQALSETDRAKIDIMDTDPTIHVANEEINFYIQRIFYIKKLLGQIDTQYGSIVSEGKDDIKSFVDLSKLSYDQLKQVYGDLTNLQLFSISKIAATASQTMTDIDTLKQVASDWKEYMRTRRADLVGDIAAVNQIVYLVNELWTTIAELDRGKAINGVDRIKFQQIDSTPLQEVVNQDRRQQAQERSDSAKKKGLSAWQVAQMMFDWIAGTITSSELFYRLGANSIEANIGLPPNSLVYLVRNYDQNGISGLDAFYQSVGQARIEENFGMPAFYFQGNFDAQAKPNFQSDLKAVYNMITTDSVLKHDYPDLAALSEADFLKYMDSLLTAPMLDYAADPWIQLIRTPGSPYSISSEPKTPGDDLNAYKAFYKKIADSQKAYTKSTAHWQAIVDNVDKRWKAKRASDVKGLGSSKYSESTVQDIVANIKQRCFTGVNKAQADGTVKCLNMTRSPEDDLLFRMGLPRGNFNAMTAENSVNNTSLWTRLAGTTQSIEQGFTIDQNAIKALFTGEDTRYINLSRKEKQVVEGSALKINTNVLSFYAQMLNGEVLPNDTDQYNLDTWTQYYVSNPYAPKQQASETCPVLYLPKGDASGTFMVNETTLENNSYCYYDAKGRHCFKSWDEAQRYAIAHEADSIRHLKVVIDGKEQEISNNILGYLANQLVLANNAALPDQATTDAAANANVTIHGTIELNLSDVYAGLVRFVNDNSMVDIFGDKNKSIAMISAIAGSTTVPASILEKLFTREPSVNSVATFKKKVGVKEAQKVVTYQIFGALQLGLAVGPDYFDAGDLYDVLNGDYTALTNIATNYIDLKAELKPGTTRLLYEARNPESITCALAQAGGSMLGRIFGLNNIPLNGIQNVSSFKEAVGQAKVEETLSLPRGTFRGNNLYELLDNVGPINFMIAFKIPVDPSVANGISDDIDKILNSNTSYSQGANLAYRLTRVRDVLSTRNILQSDIGTAIANINSALKNYFINDLLKQFENDPTKIQVALSARNQNNRDWYYAVQDFYQQTSSLDKTFAVSNGSTYQLLTNSIKPKTYINRIGENLMVTAAISNAATLLGISDAKVQAAAGVLGAIKNNFVCEKSKIITRDNYPSNGVSDGHFLYDVQVNNIKNDYWEQYLRTGKHTYDDVGFPVLVYDEVGAAIGYCSDDTYGQFGELYTNLNTLFGFNLDDRMNLPEGTISKVLSDPDHIVDNILNIGLSKLDQQLGLDYTVDGSFSFNGFWKATFYKDGQKKDAEREKIDRKCYSQSYPGGTDVAIKTQYDAANNDIKRLLGEWPARGASRIEGENYQQYSQRVTSQATLDATHTTEMRDAWVSDWEKYNQQANTASGNITIQNNAFNQCKLDNRKPVSNAALRADILDYATGQLVTLTGKLLRDVVVTIPDCQNNRAAYLDGAGSYDPVLSNQLDYFGQPIGYEECKAKVGVVVPREDLKALIQGDLRYLSPIAMTIASNIAMIPVDMWGTDNCNPDADGRCESAVPPQFKLSYNDYKYAIFGNAQSDQAARDVAAYSHFNLIEKNPDGVRINSGPEYPVSTDPFDTGLGILSDTRVAKVANQPGREIINNKTDIYTQYGYTPSSAEAVDAISQRADLQNSVADFENACGIKYGLISNSAATCHNGSPEFAAYISDRTQLTALRDRETAILGESKNLYRNNLMYKAIDIAAWKLDGNAYPGFARAIAIGTPKMKAEALVTYLKIGAQRGHLFGMDFRAVKDIEQWAGAAQFLYEAGQNILRDTDTFDPLSTLAKNPSARYFIQDFIVSRSKAWFGFEIQPDMAEGIIVGIGTMGSADHPWGNWGIKDVGIDKVFEDPNNTGVTINVGGDKTVQMKTLGGATQEYLVDRLFSWADTKLGLEAGTSFKLAKGIYDAFTAYGKVSAAIKAAKLAGWVVPNLPHTAAGLEAIADTLFDKADALALDITDAELSASLTGADANQIVYENTGFDGVDAGEKAAEDAKAASKTINTEGTKFQAAKDLVAAIIIEILIGKALGKIVAGWEQDLGMIPGTLMPLVSGIVTFVFIFVWNTVMATIGAEVLMLSQVPGLQWLAIAIAVIGFIGGMLFSTKYFYWCTADGYYPRVGSFDYNKDVGGFGEIGGRIDRGAAFLGPLMATYGVKVAQYKARQLVGDMLALQNSPRFKDSYGDDIVPIQIMTGRKVDVDFWKESIDTNMCKKMLDEDYIACDGMCGKATSDGGCVSTSRMGVWANPQTIGWTHIGF